jgi:hypothetical protein
MVGFVTFRGPDRVGVVLGNTIRNAIQASAVRLRNFAVIGLKRMKQRNLTETAHV